MNQEINNQSEDVQTEKILQKGQEFLEIIREVKKNLEEKKNK